MYIIVRKYSTDALDIVVEKIQHEFVPLISQTPGFIDYYLVPLNKTEVMIVNMYDTEVNAKQSHEMALQWVSENIAYMYSGPPQVMEGEAIISQ